MWADFLFVGIDQLVNQAANVRWLTRGRMTAPLTVRTQQGSLTSSSAQHSRCVEALLCHIPGLRVGLPSNAADAYTMLLAAIADDDPTIVIEHRAIYDQRGEVDQEAEIPAIGGAAIVRPGRDVTIVALSRMVGVALAAAELLAADGIDAEVVDPRWLSPFDWDTVEASLARTNRLVIVHEAVRTCGFGAEVAALAAERGFWRAGRAGRAGHGSRLPEALGTDPRGGGDTRRREGRPRRAPGARRHPCPREGARMKITDIEAMVVPEAVHRHHRRGCDAGRVHRAGEDRRRDHRHRRGEPHPSGDESRRRLPRLAHAGARESSSSWSAATRSTRSGCGTRCTARP